MKRLRRVAQSAGTTSLICGVLILRLLASQAYAQSDPAARLPSPSQVVVLVLRPLGFQPDQIQIPAGRTFFSVHNRSGQANLSLQFDREAGARLKAVELQRSKLAWRETVELTAGTYVLNVAGNSKWVCRITVTSVRGK